MYVHGDTVTCSEGVSRYLEEIRLFTLGLGCLLYRYILVFHNMAVFYCMGDVSYYFSNGAINTICNSGASFEPWVTTQTCVCCISHITRVHSRYFSLYSTVCVCVCVCVVIPFILDVRLPIYFGRQTCGRTSRGHTGGRLHRISPPSFCGACLKFSREKDSAIPFPCRP